MIGIRPTKRDISIAFLKELKCFVVYALDFNVVEENQENVSETEIIENTGMYLARENSEPIRKAGDYWLFEFENHQVLHNENNGVFELKLDVFPTSNVIVPTTLNISDSSIDVITSNLKRVKLDEYEYNISNIPLTAVDLKVRLDKVPNYDKMLKFDQDFEIRNQIVKVTPNSQTTVEVQHDFEMKLKSDMDKVLFYYPRTFSLKKIGILTESSEFDYLGYKLGDVYTKKMHFCCTHLNTTKKAGDVLIFRIVFNFHCESPGDIQVSAINNNEILFNVEKIDHFFPNFFGIERESIDNQMTLIIDIDNDGNVESSLTPICKEEFTDEDGIERFRSNFSTLSQSVSSFWFKYPFHIFE